MRTYPQNSPEASARILALAMLADGHLCKSEIEVIEQHRAHEQLGLSRNQWHEVLHGFCEDLLASTHLTWAEVCRIDAHTLSALLAEVDDPERRRKLMQLCVQVAEADRHMADGEAMLLVEAFRQWGLDRDTLNG
jgi:uncharacterized tellurite resistance protein B-like protein